METTQQGDSFRLQYIMSMHKSSLEEIKRGSHGHTIRAARASLYSLHITLLRFQGPGRYEWIEKGCSCAPAIRMTVQGQPKSQAGGFKRIGRRAFSRKRRTIAYGCLVQALKSRLCSCAISSQPTSGGQLRLLSAERHCRTHFCPTSAATALRELMTAVCRTRLAERNTAQT